MAMDSPEGSTRTSWKRIGVILAFLFASPFVLWTFDSLWTAPRAEDASAAFEKGFTPGLSIAELESKAKEHNADRFQVSSNVDVAGNPRTPGASVRWNAYHFRPPIYVCIVSLNQGKAESIKCHKDFM
jgi:hypothetical protein